MKRTHLIATHVLAALTLLAPPVFAVDYPSRPITAIVPFGSGGATDTMARAAVRELEEILGTKIPVKNIGGGAGTIGTARLSRSKPDGYTIGIVPAAPLINQPHMRETPYTIEDFSYICQFFYSPQALAVKPDSPFKTLKEVVEYARENPNTLTYGTPGPASLPHLAMEKFLIETGIKIKHVPFKGDAAGVTALMGGHIDLYMAIISNVVKKDLTAVAVFADDRVSAAPDVPTSIEEGFKTTSSWWGGIFAPKNTSSEIVSTLENACEKTTSNERFKQTLTDLGTLVTFRNSADLKEKVKTSSETNGAIITSILKK